MNFIQKWWKKQLLLIKYAPTPELDYQILNWSRDDERFCDWYKQQVAYKRKVYEKLKSL